jgi:excisionase family DNA binding protein
MKQYLTIQQIQAVLPLSRSSIVRMIKGSNIPTIKVKRRVLISAEDVEKLIGDVGSSSAQTHG